MKEFPYKELDLTDPKTIKDLIGAMDRPIIHLFGAKIFITTPPGCIRVEDEREERE